MNNFKFEPNLFIYLEEKYIKKKYDSLKEYKSQKYRNYMSKDFIYSLAKTRGVQVGVKYAECFEVIRMVF